MARKRKHEEHENHERWLVSYADFITLLFAFFVVMYSISSVNEGKYRVLSDALVAAFRAPAKSMLPIQVGQTAKSPSGVQFSVRQTPSVIQTFERPLPTPEEEQEQANPDGQQDRQHEKFKSPGEAEAAIKKMADEIEQAMQPLIEKDMITVRRNKLWVEVEINTAILYPSGSARLEADAVPVLEKLADILRPFPNAIHVEGFTDDVPINTLTFPSNWELSSARAASVVALFMKYGIDPTRMAAIGYGEFRPVADNGTAEGRSRNRRVVIVVLAGTDAHDLFKGDTSAALGDQLSNAELGQGFEVQEPRPDLEPAPASVVPAQAPAPVAEIIAEPAREPGEPIDVTGQAQTDVGWFAIIKSPIHLPLPGYQPVPIADDAQPNADAPPAGADAMPQSPAGAP